MKNLSLNDFKDSACQYFCHETQNIDMMGEINVETRIYKLLGLFSFISMMEKEGYSLFDIKIKLIEHLSLLLNQKAKVAFNYPGERNKSLFFFNEDLDLENIIFQHITNFK